MSVTAMLRLEPDGLDPISTAASVGMAKRTVYREGAALWLLCRSVGNKKLEANVLKIAQVAGGEGET
jgi:hypothetical protein